MKKIIIGALAHVDAGKTTLAEALFYHSHAISKKGRVDHKDAILDFNEMEKERGITIFNKEGRFSFNDTEFIYLDTPGHKDLVKEMERSLDVLDYAILIISATSGIQNQTKVIWNLLAQKEIPTLLFINKMDISFLAFEELLTQIHKEFSNQCIEPKDIPEVAALLNEESLDYYLTHETVKDKTIQEAFLKRKFFPILKGSALKGDGIDDLLTFLDRYTKENKSDEFKAYIYRISKDEKGERLTHLKLMGGTLINKGLINDEKIDEIRSYFGNTYKTHQRIEAPELVAVKGIKSLKIGDTIPLKEKDLQNFDHYLSYRFIPKKDIDPYLLYKTLKELKDEFPETDLYYDEKSKDLFFHLEGDIHEEILQKVIYDRFQIEGEFDHGQIQYKETPKEETYGVGHFEPLKHYAEVIVFLKPNPNKDIEVKSLLQNDDLKASLQNQLLEYMRHLKIVGTAIGAPVSDMIIELYKVKTHQKHTSTDDLYEAINRAIRQGLSKIEMSILEPYYQFELQNDHKDTSKILYDLDRMNCSYEVQTEIDYTRIKGVGPVSLLRNYQKELKIRFNLDLELNFYNYQKAHNEKEILDASYYDPSFDLDHPNGSIFFKQGAGFHVPFDEVEDYMHLDLDTPSSSEASFHNRLTIDDDELKRVWNSLYKPKERPKEKEVKKEVDDNEKVIIKESIKKPACYLFDGYNIIYASEELKEIATYDLANARDKLIEMICDLQGYLNAVCILVFDAYKVKNNPGSVHKYDNIHIVYTKERQTADSYIEKATKEKKDHFKVTVVSSDALEQMVILSANALRMSSKELLRKYAEFKKNLK